MSKRRKPIIALCYDFDGTLAPGNMQENSFLPDIGIAPKDFWNEVKDLSKKNDMDEILAYMTLMLKMAKAKDHKIDKKSFIEHGNTIKFFPGVEGWFKRINEYGRKNNIKIEHYIISSGLREMIQGCSIADRFRYVFASGFLYDVHNVAEWPALSVNYTTKTQYLFRINKGIMNSWDNTKINKYTPNEERPIPFNNIIYIGDGETDIPAMKMVKYQGGTSIAVYPGKKGKRLTNNEKKKRKDAKELLDNGRADYIAEANYNDGKTLDKLVKDIILMISKRYDCQALGGKR